jgi:hypothetical protein
MGRNDHVSPHVEIVGGLVYYESHENSRHDRDPLRNHVRLKNPLPFFAFAHQGVCLNENDLVVSSRSCLQQQLLSVQGVLGVFVDASSALGQKRHPPTPYRN